MTALSAAPRRSSSLSSAAIALLTAATLSGCAQNAAPAEVNRQSLTPSAGPVPGPAVNGAPGPPPTSRRDGDITDVDTLATTMSAQASGTEPWVGTLAHLRARSWLATRYPGRYDLSSIYGDEAAATAADNDRQDQAMGVYLDEPLPDLISVTKTRELGQLVELEVVLRVGTATVRGLDNDSTRGVLPGGTHRGLFMLGHDGPGGGWRIHSVTELQVVDRTTAQEPNR